MLTLVYRLRESSRFVADLAGGIEHQGWTFDRHLLVHQTNILQMVLYVLAKANSRSSRMQQPKPIPTPKQRVNKDPGENGFLQMAAKARANRENRLRQEQ